MKTDAKAILLILFLLGLFSVNCFAAIPAEQKTLDIYKMSPVVPKAVITQEDVAAIIPTDIPVGSTEDTVGKMVLDKALKSALKSNFIKSSSVAETANSLKEGMSTEMALGGSPTDPTATQHKFKVKVDPIQTRARVQYTGYFNAIASYDSGDALFEITEDFNSYRLNITHVLNDIEELSLVQLQWAW